MSETPSKRVALSPKHPNIASPFKSSVKLSPLKKFPKVVSNTTKLNFEIWQDPVTTTTGNNEVHDSLNHNDQENILQPKKLKTNTLQRTPLAPLNIEQYPGYISYNGSDKCQLTNLFQPINFNNAGKSLHKFSALPNYVTPPRSRNRKFLVKSHPEQVDDCELHLISKNLKINKLKPMRHIRSLSMGKNDAKFNLIKKNSFNIYNTSVSA